MLALYSRICAHISPLPFPGGSRPCRIFDNPSLKRVVIRNSDLIRRVVILVALEGVFILAWCLASDFTTVDAITVLAGVQPVEQSVCSSSRVEFPTAMFVWKAVQLGTGLFFAAKVCTCRQRQLPLAPNV